MENERNIEKITLTYEDGIERTIDKGFLCSMTPTEDGVEFTFDMVHISGADLRGIVGGILQLGVRMGFFGDDLGEE